MLKIFVLILLVNGFYGTKYIPSVKTTSGCVYGRYVEKIGYYSFESIPYAEKPIDDLRFEPPVFYKQKSGYINATQLPPRCIQWIENEPNNFAVGEEDCLYINVYTPSLPTCGCRKDKLPVIVFIHGGAFMFGQGADCQPDYIMQYKKAVLITFNYRLGPLGFLSTGDCEISGNMGLKDQQLALFWIKKNIASFNGCDKSIILTGFSAGAASTDLHLLNKITNTMDLVQAGISNSGNAIAPWILTSAECITERTQQLANYIGCPTNSKDFKKCLKSKAAVEIVSAMNKFQPFLYNPFRIFGPVIEPLKCNQPFLTEHPIKIIKEKKYPQIPYLVSMTKDEGGYNAAELYLPTCKGINCIREYVKKFDYYGPLTLFYGETLNGTAKNKYTEYLKNKYQLNTMLNINDPTLYFKIQKMYSDELFINDGLETIRLHRDYSLGATYHYFYDNPADFGVGNFLSKDPKIKFGCVHGDDVFIVFKNDLFRNSNPLREDEQIISKNLIEMIIYFAKTKKLKYDNIEVPKNEMNSKKIEYLHIKRDGYSIKELLDPKSI